VKPSHLLRKRFLFSALAVFVLAQLTSYAVQSRLAVDETFVVNDIVHFTYLRNTGGVFGIFQGNVAVFVLISSLTIFGLCYYVMHSESFHSYQYVCLGFVAGAAASNVCDRMLYGAVIDFINIQGIPRWHYIFNTADVMIHVGAWPLALGSLFEKKTPDLTSPS
jgi:signal peptidase II